MSEIPVASDDFYRVLLERFAGLPSPDDFPFMAEVVITLRPNHLAEVAVVFKPTKRSWQWDVL